MEKRRFCRKQLHDYLHGTNSAYMVCDYDHYHTSARIIIFSFDAARAADKRHLSTFSFFK